MTEADLIKLLELAAGLALSLIGVCRINAMHRARPAFALAYVGLTIGSAGMALGSIWPAHESEWHQALLLVSVLVLLWDTRSRWREGPPIDSGSSL